MKSANIMQCVQYLNTQYRMKDMYTENFLAKRTLLIYILWHKINQFITRKNILPEIYLSYQEIKIIKIIICKIVVSHDS